MRHRLAFASAAAAAIITLGAACSSAPDAPPPEPIDVYETSIADLQAAMASGRATSRDLVAQYLARIDAYDRGGPALNAMTALNPRALDEADALDRERRDGKVRGPLHGIPIVVKDNYETAGMPTTAGALALEGFDTGRDAFQVARLRAAGAVIVGKTNLHELAYGITTVSSLGGQTRNPYDPARNPGGSSGGTGAAVAASFAAAGMGSDTCGSIRIPSAHNNLFGLRGTQGLSSRQGIVPLASTQDIGGPLARTVGDLAVMLDATVGPDPDDPVTAAAEGRIPASYLEALKPGGLQGIRIGVLTALFGSDPEDAEVAKVVRAALEEMRRLGAEVVDVEIPKLQEQMQGTSTINAEFKFNLQDYLAGHPKAPVRSLAEIVKDNRFHRAVEGVLTRAEAVAVRNSDAYRQALAKRAALRKTVLAFMNAEKLDVLSYPTLRRQAAPIGEAQAGSNCQLSPATELPAISVPAGFTADHQMPVGAEFLGRAFSEAGLLRLAYAWEQAARPRRPPPATPPLPPADPAPEARGPAPRYPAI